MKVIESGYIIALLRSNVTVIHSLNDLEKPIQTIKHDPSFNAFDLSYSPYGISIRDIPRDERMITSRLTLLGGPLAPASIPRATSIERSETVELSPEVEEPASGSFT
jgi:hypothetical protein